MRKILSLLALGMSFFVGNTVHGACCHDWSGLYIGLNSGYGWGNADTTTTVATSKNFYFVPQSVDSIDTNGDTRLTPSGYTGGVQAGWNQQRCGLVYGLETDFGAFLLNSSKSISVTYPTQPLSAYTIEQKVTTDWLYTLRPRLGYASNKWLVFATGGLTLTNLKYRETFSDNFYIIYEAQTDGVIEKSSKSRVVAGWTFGGGVEYSFLCRLSLSISYLYTDFGHLSCTGRLYEIPFNQYSSTLNHTARLNANIVRLGINWKI